MNVIIRNLLNQCPATKCLAVLIVGAVATTPLISQHTAQAKPAFSDITFHVESVERENDPTACPIKACQATKVTLHGFGIDESLQRKTEYVLNCTELMRLEPKIAVTASCGDVHANADYKARLFIRGISFWPSGKYSPPPYHNIFDIVSERAL